MEKNELISVKEYRKNLWQLALPVTLQCLLQSSFSVVDQVMLGQLGSVNIAAVGLGGKFISLLTVLVNAIAAVAGIIIAQAVGKKDAKEAGRGFYTNLVFALVLAVFFTVVSLLIPGTIMGFYSEDAVTIQAAATYLRIYAISFIPMAVTSLLSAYLRCVNAAKIPLYAGICAAVLNTGLNYALIFGKFGCPKMGMEGAAWASVIAQLASGLVTLGFFLFRYNSKGQLVFAVYRTGAAFYGYMKILLPLFICELVWVLGENVYGYIYGHMGTKACAAMTLINPVVSLMIGALSGVAQAAGIMVGKLLGAGTEEKAYATSKKLMKTGLLGSVLLSVLLLCLNGYYVQIFQVEEDVRTMTRMILVAFAVISPVKVQNMILGGGILRSGGKTRYSMAIDMLGTWGFGVPLGLLSAFVWNLPIAWVYFILSLEEVVRLLVSLVLFRKRVWIQQL